jgi:RHS repeat-associated protein
LRFPGQYYDPETGLHYNYFRHYDPENGRYLAPDPLGLAPNPNPVTYVHNPQSLTDPLGLSPCPPDAEGVEHRGEGNQWTSDLSHVTGKTAQARNKAIDIMMREDFPDLNFTHRPEYSPWVNTGIAKTDVGTQIGYKPFESRLELRRTLVHEELHHRWYARGIDAGTHHPRDGSGTSNLFYGTVNRYLSMRGWE